MLIIRIIHSHILTLSTEFLGRTQRSCMFLPSFFCTNLSKPKESYANCDLTPCLVSIKIFYHSPIYVYQDQNKVPFSKNFLFLGTHPRLFNSDYDNPYQHIHWITHESSLIFPNLDKEISKCSFSILIRAISR